jgi:hypothetical protein
LFAKIKTHGWIKTIEFKLQGGKKIMQQSSGANDQEATPRQREEDERSGRDIPGGTGEVSDEDVNAISDATDAGETKTGQDHSTENYEESFPDSGVGAVQNANDTTSDIAHIEE